MATNCCYDTQSRGDINLSIEVFKKTHCIKEGAATECKNIMDDLKILDEEKMKCQIFDCLMALDKFFLSECKGIMESAKK
jgi:hypothetical protein